MDCWVKSEPSETNVLSEKNEQLPENNEQTDFEKET